MDTITLKEPWVSAPLQFLLLPPSQSSTTTEEGRAEPGPASPSALTDALTHLSADLSNVSYAILLPTWDYHFTNESYLPSKNSTLISHIYPVFLPEIHSYHT